MTYPRLLVFSFLLAVYLIGSPHSAGQNTASVEKSAASARIAAPAAAAPYDDSTPGVGPLRTESWFVKTWRDRRATFAKQKTEQEQALVFLGDSITQGWSDDFRGKFPGLNVANRGISGDTTRGLLARVDEDVLSLDPSGVVLLIGTNDIGLNVAPRDIAANVRLLLARIAAHSPNTPIILCEVMPTSGTKQHRPKEKVRELNQLLAELARANEHVTVVDTYTLFAGQDGEAKLEEFPDLLHPNDAGYNKWRAALWPLFATLGFVDKEPDAFTPESGFELLFNGHDLTGWGFPPTTDKEREMVKKWRASGKQTPAYPIVESPVNFDGKTASSDGRFRAIAGRLVVTTPSEGRRVQQLATTRNFTGDFTLKLDFRATPNADSGVFLCGHQLQCRDYPLAGPYKNLKNYKPQDWNELVVTVRDNKARCTCNGELLEAAYDVPASGPIGVEGDRGQMEYRRIRLRHD